jgi:hypothetical protein
MRAKPRIFAAMAALCGALGGCASGPAAPARDPNERAIAADRGTAATTGLACVRWYPSPDPALRRDGLARIEKEFGARAVGPLGAHGITALVVDQRRLADTLAALGGTPVARRTTIGQSTQWSPLSTVAIPAGAMIFANGRPERSAERLLSLSVRGWCFPTVDGACARVELRLADDPPRLTTVSLDPSRPRERAREVENGRLLVELAPDEALLVLGTPVVPPEPERTEGPEIVVPPSFGALLFPGDPFPDRAGALVIVGGFADMLPPDPAVASVRPRRTEDASPSAP